MKTILTILTIFLCLAFGNSEAKIIYVNISLGSGSNNGTSWANAFRYNNALYAGLASAEDGDEIWVTGGTYRTIALPIGCTEPICGAIDLTNRNNTYLLKSGVRMYGNFVGTETDISQRNFSGNETILSGNIKDLFDNSDNAYHVVTAINCSNSTVLDKFTIQEGNADGLGTITLAGKTYYKSWGGGMLNISSSIQIRNCSFVNNLAESGGGMLNTDYSAPNITNSIFVNNTAGGGGGIYNHNHSSPTIKNCTIANNNGTAAGGAMYNLDSSPSINNSIVWGNTSLAFAAIANNSSTSTIGTSIVQGGYTPCTDCPETHGNVDPLFINVASPSGADNRWGNADDGLQLSNCSPAIDKLPYIFLEGGDRDITGQNKPFDVTFRQNGPDCGLFCISTLDLGAYESQSTIPTKIYVNALNSFFLQTGQTWATAYTDLSDAIAEACAGTEIWVAAGTYKPSGYPAGCTGCNSNRDNAFLLKDDVKIYGGFNGTETSLNQRNSVINKSILSGDINAVGNATDNVYHVLISINDGASTKLDGLTIRDGGESANQFPAFPTITLEEQALRIDLGGGLLNYNSDIVVSNCDFISNRATSLGGGIHNKLSDPTIKNCSFIGNIGSGILNVNSNPIIESSAFISNTSPYGGGISNIISSPIINNCTFIGNNASGFGGGICNNTTCSPIITNCTFVSNYGVNDAGAIMNSTSCNPVIKNTIFWGNTSNGTPEIANSDGTSVPVISYSIIQGGYSPCTTCPNTNGNIDPQFLNIADTDGIDNVHRSFDDGIALKRTSPAINAGTNSGAPELDIIGNYKPDVSDIGAYEFIPKGNCVVKRFVADNPIEAGTHTAYTNITSNGTVGTGTSVIFEADKNITLLPGFTTQNTAVFKAEIKLTCGGPS